MNFLIDLASHPSFQAGDVHTGFIDQHIDSLFPPIEVNEQTVCQAVAALLTDEKITSQKLAAKQGRAGDPWTDSDGFRINSVYERKINLESNGNKYNIKLKYLDSKYEIQINDGEWKTLTIRRVEDSNPNRLTVKLNLGGVESNFSFVITQNNIDIFNEVRVNS